MRNFMLKSLALLMFIEMFGLVSFAQTAKRIDFAKEGSNSLVWEERVAANSSKAFVFYAKKGQKLTLSFIDDTKVGSMDLGKFSIEPNEDPIEIVIEVSKDYTLTVSNNSNKSTSFRIAISLEDAKPTSTSSVDTNLPNTERVNFPAGSIEVNLEKTVQANNAKRFVFWAKQGQDISFTVTPKRKNAKLSIDFNGTEVKSGELFTIIAPKTGDYMIQIANFDDVNQAFTLDLGIADADRTGNTSNTSTNSTSDSNGVRVQFGRGETSASVTKEIPANGSVDFLINVQKGQTLRYTVGYDFQDSDIEAFLTEPGMQDISQTSGPKKPNKFVIKKTGDHRLTVNNTSEKKVTITLYVDVN